MQIECNADILTGLLHTFSHTCRETEYSGILWHDKWDFRRRYFPWICNISSA